MRGHIAKKGGRYYAVVYEGVNRTTGRGRHRWYASGTTRREAEKVLAGLIKRQHDGDYRSPERITFGTYLLERWLPVQQTRLKRSTWDNQRRNVENHVIPHVGNIPIRAAARGHRRPLRPPAHGGPAQSRWWRPLTENRAQRARLDS